jgi:hypothetical protein
MPVSASGPLLYGTCVVLIPAIMFINSRNACPEPPVPDEPYLITPGFALACSISSFTPATGQLARTTSTFGKATIIVT